MPRFFFALRLPNDLEQKLLALERQLRRLHVDWTAQEKLHFTILYIGTASEDQIKLLLKETRVIVAQGKPEPIYCNEIDWAPPGRMTRMIWLYAKATPHWKMLKEKLVAAAKDVGLGQGLDSRPLSMHVTLARLPSRQKKDLPNIYKELPYRFIPRSLVLMKSETSLRGTAYTTLEQLYFRYG